MTSLSEKLDTGTLELDLLIKGAEALLRKGPGDWKTETTDIGIRKNRIVALGSIGKVSTKILRAEGLTVLPGLLDTQVHFREPGFEYKEDLSSGTRGALLGGITGIFEMPNTRPSTVSALDLADKVTRAKNRAWVHYAFYLGATIDNASKLAELESLPGCCGVKIFMGSSTGSLLVADDETQERSSQMAQNEWLSIVRRISLERKKIPCRCFTRKCAPPPCVEGRTNSPPRNPKNCGLGKGNRTATAYFNT